MNHSPDTRHTPANIAANAVKKATDGQLTAADGSKIIDQQAPGGASTDINTGGLGDKSSGDKSTIRK